MKQLLFAFLIFSFSIVAQATTYEEMNQKIQAFEQSGQARFSPQTFKRIQAYQGAAMIAHEEQQNQGFNTTNNHEQPAQLSKAIEQTLQTLEQAQSNASTFTTTFPDLLRLEKEADTAYVYHHKPRMLAEESVHNFYEKAKSYIDKAIRNTEKGELNLARQAAEKASLFFNKSIDAAMPGLVEQTSRALSQASSVGAKKYAPRTWKTADSELEELENYLDDISRPEKDREGIQRPKRIGYALEMAVYAQKLAIQVKDLRRDNGSHEKLILIRKQEHVDMAKALGLPLDYEKVGLDIKPEVLIQHLQRTKQGSSQTSEQYKQQIAQMQQDFEQKLQQALEEQHLKDQEAFQTKITRMKAAFSSKLERETFEKKRQAKVRSLFKKGEAEIIANLDGSLMIRAKKIQFGSNSSKVDGKYFDFLSRIKEALMMYPDRHIKIEGHTDSSGDAKANRKLSLARAEAVQNYLISSGIEPNRIRALGYGEAKPIATNMYKKGRAMNRRIDITIEAPKP